MHRSSLRFRIFVLGGVVALAAGCGGDSPFDPTPPEPFVLSLTAPESIDAEEVNGGYRCMLSVQASATGPQGSYATWTSNAAVIVRRLTSEEVIGGVTFDADYFNEQPPRGWGHSRLEAGQTRTMQVQVQLQVLEPFRIEFLAEYRPSTTGEFEVGSVTSRCE